MVVTLSAEDEHTLPPPAVEADTTRSVHPAAWSAGMADMAVWSALALCVIGRIDAL
jgi:hypothetical protein